MPRFIAAHCFAILFGIFFITSQSLAAEIVQATWYGDKYHGRPTASGVKFDRRAYTAAHPTLPLGSEVVVRRLDSKRAVRVRITDRCGRCGIDLSRAAAKPLGLLRDGRALVQLETVMQIAWGD